MIGHPQLSNYNGSSIIDQKAWAGRSKHETNSNDQNTNDRNEQHLSHGGQYILNLGHSDFDIVSDFGFRYSDFLGICSISFNMLNCRNRVQNL